MKNVLAKSVRSVLPVVFGSIVALPALAQDLTSAEQRAGYSIGVNIGANLVGQGLMEDLDMEALVMGIRDAASGELKLDESELMAAIQEFSMLQQEKAQAAMAAFAEQGREFLASNATQPGVMTTASGLQYQVITSAADSSAPMPSEEDTVSVHYEGTLTDGTVFDSSVQRGQPATFPLNGVIPGWTEGLQLMRVGDKFRFFVPSDLAYGPNGAGDAIPPNAVLIFDVELLEIQ
jgi:FKBP-type peptidyl-prolyl cis-trans isomerase FklB